MSGTPTRRGLFLLLAALAGTAAAEPVAAQGRRREREREEQARYRRRRSRSRRRFGRSHGSPYPGH